MKNYTGRQLKEKFIKRGILQKEDVIESIIKDAFTYSSDGAIETCKEPSFRGVTDGIFTMYKTNARKEILCKIVNETKRGISRNTKAYTKQVIQCLGYAIQFFMEGNVKFLTFTSDSYIDYMSIEENIDLIWKYMGILRNGLDKYPPNELYKFIPEIDISQFVIYKHDIDDDFNIKDIITSLKNQL